MIWVHFGLAEKAVGCVDVVDAVTLAKLREAIQPRFTQSLHCLASQLVVKTKDADNKLRLLEDAELVLGKVLTRDAEGKYRVYVEVPPKEPVAEGPLPKKAKKGVAKLAITSGHRVAIEDLFPMHAGQRAKSLFVTDSMTDILGIFDERVAAKDGIWFAGAPGTGKSQLGRLWATHYAQREGCDVLYGETRGARYWLTWVKIDGWIQYEVKLEQFFRTLTTESDNPDQVVILDGAAQASAGMADLAFSLMDNKKIVISSGQLVLKNVGLPHIQLPAWTLDEILLASEDQGFFQETALFLEEKFENRKKFITTKFSITGGAPRLMFESKTREVENVLSGALSKLGIDDKKQVLFGNWGPSHERSQNALIHYFVNPSIENKADRYQNLIPKFSSQFVLRKLQAALVLGDIQQLYAQCQSLNRVMEGWAFEELILRQLSDQPGQVQKKVAVRGEGQEATEIQHWTTSRLVSLDMEGFKAGKLNDTDGKAIEFDSDRLMLRPNIYNNESWDAVILERVSPNWQLKFLEVTIQPTHSLNEMAIVRAFNIFNEALGNVLPIVHHHGVVDHQQYPTFHFVRTIEISDRETRSGHSVIAEGFRLVVSVANLGE